jgi:hypothetical protein
LSLFLVVLVEYLPVWNVQVQVVEVERVEKSFGSIVCETFVREDFDDLGGFLILGPGPELVVSGFGDDLLVPLEGLPAGTFPNAAVEGSTPLVVDSCCEVGWG